MSARCYTLTCESGTIVLVRASSVSAANAKWDRSVDDGEAEPRIACTTSPASRADIRWCVEMGHDYR